MLKSTKSVIRTKENDILRLKNWLNSQSIADAEKHKYSQQ
jgi:hypothetical protein